MKKLRLTLFILPALLFVFSARAGSPANVDQQLLKAFAAAYPAAEKISWTEEKGHFVVHFVDHGARAVMEYDADARMISSYRYYSDPGMIPQNISWNYHRRFPDKTIFGIIEVSDGEVTVWFLKGQNEKQWTTVKATANGEMEVVEKMKKQS